MNIASASEIGLVRKQNQDRVACVNRPDHTQLVMVCDGIGGGNAGEVAAQIAVDVLSTLFAQWTQPLETRNQQQEFFTEAIRQASERIQKKAQEDISCRGMGTTLVAVILGQSSVLGINIGDSRIYRLSEGHLSRLSNDHSLVFEMMRQGRLTEDEAAHHPQRNILINALGVSQRVQIEWINPGQAWSRLLLCSDGLHGYVDEQDIEAVLKRKLSVRKQCTLLMDLAYRAGGYDNVSLIIVSGEVAQ